jgi:cell division protein FtsA
MPIPAGKQILDVIPKQYIVDGYDGIKDPEGMVGVRLEIEAGVVIAAQTTVQNLVRTVERAGLSVIKVVVSPLLLEKSVIYPDEKEMGVLVIDIGGTVTDIMAFHEGQLKYVGMIPIGGDYITNDLAICLKTSFQKAEDIKRSIGCALVSEADKSKVMEVETMGKGDTIEVNQVEIAEIIEPRVQEIFSMIRKSIENFNKSGIVVSSAVVVGGGVTYLDGFLDVATFQLGMYVRVGENKYAGVQHPKYAIAVGLLEYGKQIKPVSRIGSEKPKKSGENPFSKIIKFLKEYF